MKNFSGLAKTAAIFGFLLTLTHVAHHKKAEAEIRRQKKAAREQKKRMKKALKRARAQMEALHANPPVRIPVPPDTRN